MKKKTLEKQTLIIIISSVIVVALLAVGGIALAMFPGEKDVHDHNGHYEGMIMTFQECADAGYPISQTYPEQCTSKDGTFTK